MRLILPLPHLTSPPSPHLTSSHLISSHPISPHLISSHLPYVPHLASPLSPHLTSTHLISSHLISLTSPSSPHLTSPQLLHLTSPHVTSSHFTSSHFPHLPHLSHFTSLSHLISFYKAALTAFSVPAAFWSPCQPKLAYKTVPFSPNNTPSPYPLLPAGSQSPTSRERQLQAMTLSHGFRG